MQGRPWSAVCGIFTEEFIFISNLYKKKLLKFNLNGVFHSDIQFHNGPYDIAKFRENELAVAFIDSQEIQLINIHTMTIGWKIVLTVPVGGLRYMNSNNQFVTACDKCIGWLNASNGQKIKETKTNGNTFYVCASEKTDTFMLMGRVAWFVQTVVRNNLLTKIQSWPVREE